MNSIAKKILPFLVMINFCALAEMRPPRVEITSQPEGAKIIVDGVERGRTPQVLYDLKPGARHLKLELQNYESEDDFFNLQEGVYTTKHFELIPIKGLLLLTSEPSGAQILLNGLSYGETPRLITSLDARKSYRFELRKTGYQSRLVDVKFNEREGVVKNEKLLLDSGVLTVMSEPKGANVTVNGLSRGVTPLTIKNIPKGIATVLISHDGYKSEKRELKLNAGEEQTLSLMLEGLPGKMSFTSVPDAARIYIDNVFQGKTPIVIPNLKPGEYLVKAESDGYASVQKELVLKQGQTINEEFRLESNLCRLEIRTQPSDVEVFVDARHCGRTQLGNSASERSNTLTITELSEGEHTVVFKRHGYGEVVKRITLVRQRALPLDVKLSRVFTPDIRIETITGSYTGVLISQSPETIVLEVSPGVNRAFPRADTRKVEILKVNEIK